MSWQNAAANRIARSDRWLPNTLPIFRLTLASWFRRCQNILSEQNFNGYDSMRFLAKNRTLRYLFSAKYKIRCMAQATMNSIYSLGARPH